MRRRVSTSRRSTGGYTTAERWIVGFDDGLSCFVKSGAGQLAEFLRAEHSLVYSRIRAAFLPELIAWEDDGVAPILVLEDLSHAHWPPPWTESQVLDVLDALDALQAFSEDLPGLLPIESRPHVQFREGWSIVEREPAPFLALGLCSARWLSSAMPVLQQACLAAPLAGEDVLHFDVRSDNICFEGSRTVLVDWNHIGRGNRALDVATWLPSLHSEGGPPPEEVRFVAPELAAVVAGYFARYAGLPPIPQAPRVRQVQLSQLKAALPWAQRALGLPALDGTDALDR